MSFPRCVVFFLFRVYACIILGCFVAMEFFGNIEELACAKGFGGLYAL